VRLRDRPILSTYHEDAYGLPDESAKRRGALQNEARVVLGGCLAEEVVLGQQPDGDRCRYDRGIICGLLGGSDMAVHQLRDEVRAFLSREDVRAAVRAIATALLNSRSLDGNRVRMVCHSVGFWQPPKAKRSLPANTGKAKGLTGQTFTTQQGDQRRPPTAMESIR
jgi:hypothetical protein